MATPFWRCPARLPLPRRLPGHYRTIIPTVSESGVPGYEVASWNGWLAHSATPPEIIAKLNTELVKAAKSPDVGERMAVDGGEPLGTTPGQFRRHLTEEIARWRKVVQVAGIRVD